MASFYKQVPNEVIAELPTKTFHGEITIVDNDNTLADAINYLNNKPLLGFDTETRPSFKKGDRHQVALLQLSTNEKAFLFRLDKIGLPQNLIDILANGNITKTGVAIHDDIKALQSHTDFKPEGFIELQTYVSEFGIEDKGLKKLTCNILGFRISKKDRLSNWEDENYTDSQKEYAATDAWVSFEIYTVLSNHKGNVELK